MKKVATLITATLIALYLMYGNHVYCEYLKYRISRDLPIGSKDIVIESYITKMNWNFVRTPEANKISVNYRTISLPFSLGGNIIQFKLDEEKRLKSTRIETLYTFL